MTNPIPVTLCWSDVLYAACIGCVRNVSSMKKGLHPRAGASEALIWDMHIEGAAGELACCLAMGWEWPATVDTFHAPDAMECQIRTRSEEWYDLLVRPVDPVGRYILVTGRIPNFAVVGFYDFRGWAVEAEEFPGWIKEHGGRPPALFIPQENLRDMEEIDL
jgi:hypothetical protein